MKWKVAAVGDSVAEMSRRLAFVPNSPVHSLFDTQDARFGSFLSKDSFGCRLNLTVKPEVADGEEGELLVFAFNYHRDIEAVIRALSPSRTITRLYRQFQTILRDNPEFDARA